MTILKNVKRAVIVALVCAVLISSSFVVPCGAANVNSPYNLINGGCVKSVEMRSSEKLHGGLTYYTANVTSHIQGLLSREAIPYEVYGAIGNSDTKMFVYSIGTDDGQDYTTHRVVEIVEQFERDNPAWDAVVATNGDFVDIEKVLTACIGEPEGPMIQLGSVIKGNLDNVPGRGVVGVKSDGTVIYKTIGEGYEQNGYGTDFAVSNTYLDVTFSSKDNGDTIAEYSTCYGATFNKNKLYLSTVNSGESDLSGRTVCVVKCGTYRHNHVPGNGVEGGTLGNYVLGEVVEIRKGRENDKAESGYVLLSFPKNINGNKIKVGMTVECEPQLKGEWREVINAVGYKQQILAEGNVLLKNCYGTYNQSGDYEETLRWTADIYDYPHCWKNRTVLGFKDDNTPVLLVAARSSHEGAYKNLGASYYEMGEQLKALGCVNGFLLDGGGSSTFVIRNADGTFSNAFVGEGNGRAVGNAVILAVRDKSVPLPEDEKTSEVTTSAQTTVSAVTKSTANVMTTGNTMEKKSKLAPVIIAVATVTVIASGVTVVLARKRRK